MKTILIFMCWIWILIDTLNPNWIAKKKKERKRKLLGKLLFLMKTEKVSFQIKKENSFLSFIF